jgi:hypothetical protein
MILARIASIFKQPYNGSKRQDTQIRNRAFGAKRRDAQIRNINRALGSKRRNILKETEDSAQSD